MKNKEKKALDILGLSHIFENGMVPLLARSAFLQMSSFPTFAQNLSLILSRWKSLVDISGICSRKKGKYFL